MFNVRVYYIVCISYYAITHSRQYNADMPFGVQSLLVIYILRIVDDIIRPIHKLSRARLPLQQISVN